MASEAGFAFGWGRLQVWKSPNDLRSCPVGHVTGGAALLALGFGAVWGSYLRRVTSRLNLKYV